MSASNAIFLASLKRRTRSSQIDNAQAKETKYLTANFEDYFPDFRKLMSGMKLRTERNAKVTTAAGFP
jgi:hypothetical protein